MLMLVLGIGRRSSNNTPKVQVGEEGQFASIMHIRQNLYNTTKGLRTISTPDNTLYYTFSAFLLLMYPILDLFHVVPGYRAYRTPLWFVRTLYFKIIA